MIRKIYKFGGASVKDADAVRNLAQIVSQHKDEDIMLVVSAMGKTTNALEKALANFREHDGQLGMEALHEVIAYHDGIIQGRFNGNTDSRFDENIAGLFIELWEKLQKTDTPYDYQYDQTVCYGELISTSIIHEYLTNTSANATSRRVGLTPANMSSPRTRHTTAPPTPIGTRQDSESAS